MLLSVFIAQDDGQMTNFHSYHMQPQTEHKAERCQQRAASHYEMNVTYSSIEALSSSRAEETKGSVKIRCCLSNDVCEILSPPVWACQAALLLSG